MTALTTEAKIIAFFSLPSELTGKLDTYIKQASDRVADLIGTTQYTTLSALPDADDDRKRADHAESALALYYALPRLNLRFTSKGGLVKAVGFEQSRTEIMSPFEMAKARGRFWTDAHNLLEKWIQRYTDADGDLTEFRGPFSMSAIEDADIVTSNT